MMPRYTITEPHPSVAQNSYIHSGRGGAGNFMRAPLTTAPAGVPTPLHPTTSATSATSSASRSFYSGRGGAGNAHSAIERPVLSFEEEFRSRESAASTRGYLVGRGGAGNFAATGRDAFVVRSGSSGKRRTSSSSAGSVASSASGASSASEGWRKRLSGALKL